MAIRALALIATILVAIAGCGTTVDSQPTVVVGTARYTVLAGSQAGIKDTDLEPFGTATSIVGSSSLAGTDVFRLAGVDPAQLLVARAGRPSLGQYVLLVQDLKPATSTAEFVRSIPGLCAYFPSAPCS